MDRKALALSYCSKNSKVDKNKMKTYQMNLRRNVKNLYANLKNKD